MGILCRLCVVYGVYGEYGRHGHKSLSSSAHLHVPGNRPPAWFCPACLGLPWPSSLHSSDNFFYRFCVSGLENSSHKKLLWAFLRPWTSGQWTMALILSLRHIHPLLLAYLCPRWPAAEGKCLRAEARSRKWLELAPQHGGFSRCIGGVSRTTLK